MQLEETVYTWETMGWGGVYRQGQPSTGAVVWGMVRLVVAVWW